MATIHADTLFHPTSAPPAGELLLEDPAIARSERKVLIAMTVTMVAAIMTMKVAIPLVPGQTMLQLALVIVWILFGYLAAIGRLRISPIKLMLFLIFSGGAIFVHILQPDKSFSVPSLLYVLTIYATYIFMVPVREETLRRYLLNFQLITIGAAVMVGIDWAFQFAGMKMPSIETIIPKPVLFFNYVYLQPLEWGSRFDKPNGFFFLETSYVSQFMAFGLVLEICLFQRLRYMAVQGLALVASFGGTGLLLVVLCAPVVLFYFRLRLLPLLLISAPIVGIAAFQLGLVENAMSRTEEFSEDGSSGNQRFNRQFERVGEVFRGPTENILIGIGAGQMPQHLHVMWTPISKVVVEYGVFVYAAFWLFFFYAMFGNGIPFIVSWMMTMQYLFLNGSFLVPMNSVFNVLLAALLVVPKELRRRDLS